MSWLSEPAPNDEQGRSLGRFARELEAGILRGNNFVATESNENVGQEHPLMTPFKFMCDEAVGHVWISSCLPSSSCVMRPWKKFSVLALASSRSSDRSRLQS